MISSINQLRMNMLDMQNVSDIKSVLEDQDERIFAHKGEENYKEEMDYNHDGVVTYDEYLRYCSENAVSQYSSNPSIKYVSVMQNLENNHPRPLHIGKMHDL